jgi:hypothetical protein
LRLPKKTPKKTESVMAQTFRAAKDNPNVFCGFLSFPPPPYKGGGAKKTGGEKDDLYMEGVWVNG